METDKFTEALSKLTATIFGSFVARGGVLRDGDKLLSPDVVASKSGGLPAVLWMTKEFIDGYELGFPEMTFRPDGNAYAGYVLESIVVHRSASSELLKVSDFLRKEVVPEGVIDLDLANLFANYREWCLLNIPGITQQADSKSEHLAPE